jgi:hypothetical protein
MKRLICWAIGHDFSPPPHADEFILVNSICTRCKAVEMTFPYGECAGGHPITQHYDLTGELRKLPSDVCSTRWPR